MKTYLKKNQWPIVIVNTIVLTGFALYFLSRANYEFLLYIGIIVLVFVLILSTNKKVEYSNLVLWGLTIWGIMHMSGGGLRIGDNVLYAQILFPLSKEYEILKYDQVVHLFGFGVATIIMYEIIRKLLVAKHSWAALSIVVVMAGLGVGALNEIIEFIATVLVPETGVGGYNNTALDLVANFIGALIALAVIRMRASAQN